MEDPEKSARYSNLPADVMQVGLEVAGVGLGTVDYRSDTVNLDPLTAMLFDLPAGKDLPRTRLHGRIHPEDWPEVAREVDRLLDPAEADVIDLTHRILLPDGTLRWVHARKRVQFEGAFRGARPVTGVFAVVDVSARQRAELRAQMLIGELNHRAKNLITVIIGIARQLDRDGTPGPITDRLIERLTALARNQDALTGNAEGEFDLREVLEHQLLPFRDAHGARISLTVPKQTLSSGAAQIVAMAVHELLTNATKHGALSGPGGQVEIGWQVDGDTVRFSWVECGRPAVTAPGRTGFGTQVLTRLTAASLDAQVALDYAPEGLRFAFTAPLQRITGA